MIYKMDCHTHPIAHVYYPDMVCRQPLSKMDKMKVEVMIKSGIDRGLDAIAITDHNMCTSGLYGKQYAKENELPIIVVPGCECSVMIGDTEIHVLALGLLEPFDFIPTEPVAEIVDKIQCAGGIAVLAHPHYYPLLYDAVADIVDGVEVYNGVAAAIYPDNEHFNIPKDFKGIQTKGSDYHMQDFLLPEQQVAVINVDESSMRSLYRRIMMAAK